MNLEEVTFGNQVAENEASALSSYFVETQPWKKLFKGEVDVIFGSKGAGKSALYTLLLKEISFLYPQRSQQVKQFFLICPVSLLLKKMNLLHFGKYIFVSSSLIGL